MMKKLIRTLAAALAAATLLASASFAAPAPGGGMPGDTPPAGGDGGFDLGDFAPGGGSSGPAKVYDIETFTDHEAIRNQEAVAALVDLGLLNGVEQADKSLAFEPKGELNRGAMAKLASLAVTLISGEEIKGEAKFTDTAGRWSEDYVAYCADKGMIDGDGNGKFRPNDSVTGLELAKVLVAAMGVKDGLTGAGWEENVRKAAQEKGLLEGVPADLGQAITRDDAARMICNALKASDGALPEDYVPTFVPGEMMECPWMTGGKGNNRATNLLGEDSIAAYINTTVTAEKWGVLSSDNCTRGNIVGINSTLQTTNDTGDGYGNLVIGSAKGTFLGAAVKVGGYGSYIMSGDITYGDSTVEAVAKLNKDLGLGLTEAEITALGVKSSSIDAGRSAFLQTGAGNIDISGKTTVTSKWAVFALKGASSNITVDGSKGASLKSTEDNVILQMLDNDDPGAMDGSYEDKTTAPEKDAEHDLTKAEAGSDVLAAFKDMKLEGDFFNGVRGDQTGGMFNPGKVLRNLKLTLDNTTLTGQVSASSVKHVGKVTEANYQELGHVTNTPCAAVNNGVIVELKNASKWTVTETSYLTSLTVGEGCTLAAPAGKTLTVTVDGAETAVAAGQTYTGAIVLTVK